METRMRMHILSAAMNGRHPHTCYRRYCTRVKRCSLPFIYLDTCRRLRDSSVDFDCRKRFDFKGNRLEQASE
jgi:hypothetical protein